MSAPGALHSQDTERLFQLLVASIKDYAIFMLDPSGKIISWNAGAQRIKGYQPEEIIGQHISIFYTPEDLAQHRPQKLLDLALRDGRVEDTGWRVRKYGSRFWADVVITAVRDPSNGLTGFAKVTRDLTEQRHADELLRHSEESLRATLYSIGDAVLATDETGRVTRINPVAERLTGWSEREAIGSPLEEVFQIINEETRLEAPNPVTRVLREGVVVGLANHTALIARDGTEHPIADSGAPIHDSNKRTRGAVLVFRDVTEERRAQDALAQSEERLRLMLSSVADYAIFMLDPQGRVATWNPGVERINGYRAVEIIGSHLSRFFTPEDVAKGKPQHELDEAVRQGRFEDEAWRVRKDGSRFWANVVLTPMRDVSGNLVGFVKVTRDLTERRRMDEERIQLAQAQEAVRLRDEFLSIASHELKTPLTALQLQLLGARDRALVGDPRVADRIERALRVGERLGQLIETLLDVARIATGTLTLNREPFDLGDAVREVVDRFRDAATQAGCTLSASIGGSIRGRWDRLRVEQVLMNLISNAIKYGPGHPIRVSACREGDDAILVIHDGGPGIPEADLMRIFERFERAASARNFGGLGLGLYVARQIAEAHGGSITAANAKEGGAVFTVRLPLDLEAAT